MNNASNSIQEDTSKYLSIITQQYPHFFPEDITDMKEIKGKISFQYHGCFFICFEQQWENKTLFDRQLEFVQFMMSWFWWNQIFQSQIDAEIHFELLEKLKSNIIKFFPNIDTKIIKNIRITDGYAIFNYREGLYLSPLKYDIRAVLKWEYLDIWVDIYQTVEQYYPNVVGTEISDIRIYNMSIIFIYKQQMYFCPLQPEQKVLNDIKKALWKESEFLKNQENTKKAVLKLVYSKSN